MANYSYLKIRVWDASGLEKGCEETDYTLNKKNF